MRETTICKICFEPIFNPICVDCLSTSTKKWLSINIPQLLTEFQDFSKNLKEKFEFPQEEEKCAKCGNRLETTICPYCYSREVYGLLSLKDEKLAKNFIKFFNFDFLNVGYSSENTIKNLIPVMIVDEEESSDINICENCGNQSDDLKEVNGNYICEVCRDENNF